MYREYSIMLIYNYNRYTNSLINVSIQAEFTSLTSLEARAVAFIIKSFILIEGPVFLSDSFNS